jgi:YihY family inner membrane protein
VSFPQEQRRQRPGVVEVVRATVEGVRSDQITFIAASLAYYAFISLLPLLLLGIVAASVFGGEALAFDLAESAAAAFGPQAEQLVLDTLTNESGQAGASVVGIAFLLWSGLKLFRGLDVAFSTVYGAPMPDSILTQLRDAIVALGGVGLGVVATVAVGAVVALADVGEVGGIDVLGIVGTVLLVGGLTAAFLPLYYVLPARGISVREALPGAVFSGVGWALLQFGFRIYAEGAGASGYGILGGVLLLVTFLYFGGLILLVGVVLNAVLAGRMGEDDAEREMGTTDGQTRNMTDDNDADGVASAGPGTGPGDDGDGDGDGPGPGGRGGNFSDEYDGDVEAELERLYDELDRFEEEFEDRTVHREEIERELKRYVRGRQRRGKARGWGPYLVLLYGTAMTLGAFVYLSSGWAILAMLVIWLSTLGLYVLMLIVGGVVGAAGLPGRLQDRFGAFRD